MSIQDAMAAAAEELAQAELNERYKTDIRLWAKDKLGYTLWNKQVAIAEALLKHRRVAVKSGHGVGKSFTASIIMAWFIDTRKDLDALAVSTAPTQPQLGIIWEYLRDHHRKGKLFGRVSLDNDYKGDDDSMRGMGRKPSNTNEHAFQGQHRRNGVLACIDEACGVPESLFVGVDVITTGAHDFCLAIGNPDDVNTPFGKIFRTEDPTWHRMTISSLDSPNFTGEDFPEDARGGLVTPEWVEGRKISWGENSPRYKSKVLGEFSLDGTNSLFPEGTLAIGRSTELTIKQDSRPILGVDVARMGEDYSVIYSYQDGVLRLVDKWAKANSVETSARIVQHAFALGAKEVRIDGVGLGGPIIDFVRRDSENRFVTIGMVGNAASPDLDKWINARAFWYDTMREDMLNARIDLDDEDTDLTDELGDLEYHFKNARNALQIASKEEIRLKTGKSPDFADAAMYACADILIDPTDPVNQLKPGETFEVDATEMLFSHEKQISPF